MWLMLLKSGVHATVGGVLLALTIPSRVRIESGQFAAFGRKMIDTFERSCGDAAHILTNPRGQGAVHSLEIACEQVQTPLNRLEQGLHRWVAFIVMRRSSGVTP